MNRELLYRYLETRFSEAGLDGAQIQLQTDYYHKKFGAMNDRELSSEIQKRGGPAALADEAVRLALTQPLTKPQDPMRTKQDLDVSAILGEKSEDAECTAEAKTIAVDRAKIVRADAARISEEAGAAATPDAVPSPDAPQGAPAPADADTCISAVTEEEAQQIEDAIRVRTEQIEKQEKRAEKNAEKPEKKRRSHSSFYYKTWRGTPTPEQQKHFKTLLLASSPLWGLALLLGAALLLGVLCLIGISIPGLLLLMLVWVGGGCAVSLVGLIYGLSQVFLVMPKGLDEIGLGIMAAGFTLMGGILLYNAALRLMPFLWHRWVAFIRRVLRTVPEFYGYVRGEVYRR